jgi:PTS system mannose-specific IIB component/fructoselysine and glucoselysine-specific PTS system IIB component
MPIVLQRVDERLIHGQVVIGWGAHLRPTRYLVVDDDLAQSDWEQELYALGAGESEAVFTTVDVARSMMDRWRSEPQKSILLTKDISTMLRLAAGGLLSDTAVNLGGIHHGPHRTEVLTYLHLAPEDRDDLDALAAEGVTISARDLPDAHKVPLEALVK